jgi:phage baseplate assembly protein W|tara:strand:+ start:1613 stop:2050 length:438 start_codon:yes stop_codon:yes gene_type:complete
MALTPNSFSDASASKSRSTKVYKDVSLSFTRHPITGDIAKLTDADAVKRSVRNLINTDFYERPFHPEIGSNIRKTLFEPVDVSTAEDLSTYIEECIVNFEPRVELKSVQVNATNDMNGYNVIIEFYLVNSQDGLETIEIGMERLR